jgi:acyl carrier protein
MAPHPALGLSLSSSGLRIEVHRLLSFILRRPVGDEENPSRATEPGWDSLKHVELVFLIEDHFGMRFSEQEIVDLEDAGGIERLVDSSRRGDGCGTA